jgi:hypothetical protein
MANFERALFPGMFFLDVRHSTFFVRYSTFRDGRQEMNESKTACNRPYDVIGWGGVGGFSGLASLGPAFSPSALGSFSSMPYSV